MFVIYFCFCIIVGNSLVYSKLIFAFELFFIILSYFKVLLGGCTVILEADMPSKSI